MSESYEDMVLDAEDPDEEHGGAAEPLEVQARRLVDKRRARDKSKAQAEKDEKAYREEEREFWTRMHDQLAGTSTINPDLGPGYGKVQIQRRETIRGKVLDVEQALASLSEDQRKALLNDRAIRQKVLNQFVKTRREAGQPLPPGFDFSSNKHLLISEKG